MRTVLPVLCGLLLGAAPLAGQAPAWAELWRVAEGTLVRPAALAEGPTGTFWNPAAAVANGGPAFAVDVYQSPDVVNVSGVVLAGTWGLGHRGGVGLVLGRASVGDLIRTSTSPIAEGGEIPVYSQFAGAVAAARLGFVEGGANVLLHDARLDGLDNGGLTLDVGLRVRPLAGLVLAGATHLGEPVATNGAASEYLAGAEYGLGIPPILGLEAHLQIRYGATFREAGRSDHLGSVGLILADRLLIDGGVLWAGGYGTGAWQPLLGLAFRAGPFRVGIARGSGASGIGATYRITLGVSRTP